MTSKEKHDAIVEAGGRLGLKMAEFANNFLSHLVMEDHVLKQVDLEKFRADIEEAVAAGFDFPQAWYMLATATEEPEERLRLLFRVLKSLHWEMRMAPPRRHAEWWEQCLMRLLTFYELGLVHTRAGRTGAATDSFERALSFAHSLRAYRPHIIGPPPELEDQLEGKITAAMLLLDAAE